MDDVSGVILFRPTVSPIVFKQQIGRALTVGKRDCAKQNGDLLVPKSHVTEEGYHLGEWIIAQRVMHKNRRLSPVQTQKLERIGMDWRGRNEAGFCEYIRLYFLVA